MSTQNPHPAPTAIKSVGYYIACPVECCDRCGQGIKHVFPVQLKDGTIFRYGSECINTVLAGDTSLAGLWRKNAKLLVNLKRDLEVLNRPYDQIPAGKVAVGGHHGLRFISHEENGSWMSYGRCAFHPLYPSEQDFDGRPLYEYASDRGRFNTRAEWDKQCAAGIAAFKTHIEKEIARIEPFLARILAKGLAGQNKVVVTPPAT